MKKVWCFDPHGGGVQISPMVQKIITARINNYEVKQSWYPHYQLKIRYKGQFCYLDASKNDDDNFFPIGRLRHFNEDQFSLAFYTYSNEKYSPCTFSNGNWFGSIEDAIDICSVYLE